MRRFFTVLALPLLWFGLTAAHKASDREDEELLGAVRSISSQIVTKFAFDPNYPGRPQQQDLVSYDTRGNEAERTIYDDYGFLAGRQVNKRDSNGHAVESILSDPKGAVMERVVRTYSGGKLAETIRYDGKGKVSLREVNSYDENGRLAEETYYEGDKAAAKTVYRYDEAGRGSETAFFMADGSKAIAPIGPCLGAHRMTFTYDSKGRPYKVVSYEPNGRVKKSWLYAYNDKGLMSEEKLEDSYDHTTNTHLYEYDSRGNWIKRMTTTIRRPKPDRLSPEEKKQYPGLLEPSEARTTIARTITYH